MYNVKVIKTLIAASILAAGVANAAGVVSAPGGTVHFKGEIVNAACAVSADSTNQTVDLGQYRTALFTKVGDRSGPVSFVIKLQDCDTTVSTTAAVAFSGVSDATDSTVLTTSNIGGGTSGAASGVGIEISDNKGKVLSPDGSSFSTAQKLNDGRNELTFNAKYKSTSATVTAGRADADAMFTMQYE